MIGFYGCDFVGTVELLRRRTFRSGLLSHVDFIGMTAFDYVDVQWLWQSARQSNLNVCGLMFEVAAAGPLQMRPAWCRADVLYTSILALWVTLEADLRLHIASWPLALGADEEGAAEADAVAGS